jgi:NADPH:quinone reductase-like Zn-dependent oxidoreductase
MTAPQNGQGSARTFAIQLAKHLGVTVATTTSAANVELMKQLVNATAIKPVIDRIFRA